MGAISVHFLVKVLIVFSMLYAISAKAAIKQCFKSYIDMKKEQIELERFKHETSVEISSNINEKLDLMIQQCFDEYTILNLAFKSDFYITEEEEIKINKEISHIVAERLSPAFINQLSLLYNEEAIYDVVSKRVFFMVTNFVMDHNQGTGL